MIVIDDSKQSWITHVEKIWFLFYTLFVSLLCMYTIYALCCLVY